MFPYSVLTYSPTVTSLVRCLGDDDNESLTLLEKERAMCACLRLLHAESAAFPGRHFALFFFFIPNLLHDFLLDLVGTPLGPFVRHVSTGQGDAVPRSHPSRGNEGTVFVGSRRKAETVALIGTTLPLNTGNDFKVLVEMLLAVEFPSLAAIKVETVVLETIAVVVAIQRHGRTRDTERLVGIAKGLEGVTHRSFDLLGIGLVRNGEGSVEGYVETVASLFGSFKDTIPNVHGFSVDDHGGKIIGVDMRLAGK